MKIRSTALFLATIFIGFSSVHVAAQSVSLYRDCNYGGGGANLGAGKYNIRQLRGVGLFNDDISSMIVDEGFAIVYYEDANFKGIERIVWGPAEMPCLIDDGSDNKISSFIIEDQRVQDAAPNEAAGNTQSEDGSFYNQPLEGVYSQNWWVENIYYNSHRSYSVDIKGEGKLGEFSGNLAIRCGRTVTWQWGPIVQELWLDEKSVPDEALVKLSAFVCRDS